jgi:hypothetical protein
VREIDDLVGDVEGGAGVTSLDDRCCCSDRDGASWGTVDKFTFVALEL